MSICLSKCRFIVIIACSALLGLVGCATHAPDNALGKLPAYYSGTLPCGDCADIDYQLTLSADHLYVLDQHDASTPASQDVIEVGRWSLDAATGLLALQPADSDSRPTNRWHVDTSNRITARDADGQPINSSLNVSLNRQATPSDLALTGTRWILPQSDHPDTSAGQIPYIQLDADTQRVTGSTGCNQLASTYRQQANVFTLGQLTTTRMACGQLGDTEQAFLTALSQTQRVRVMGAYLLLYGKDGAPAPLEVLRGEPATPSD